MYVQNKHSIIIIILGSSCHYMIILNPYAYLTASLTHGLRVGWVCIGNNKDAADIRWPVNCLYCSRILVLTIQVYAVGISALHIFWSIFQLTAY